MISSDAATPLITCYIGAQKCFRKLVVAVFIQYKRSHKTQQVRWTRGSIRTFWKLRIQSDGCKSVILANRFFADSLHPCDEFYTLWGVDSFSFCVHRKFSSKLTMRRHMGIHQGEKPFECPHCHYCTRLKASLTQHLRVHTGSPNLLILTSIF